MIYKGQTLYRESKNESNTMGIDKFRVLKVNKNTFLLEGLGEKCPVNLATLRYDSFANNQNSFQLYTSIDDLLEARERKRLYSLISKHFSWTGGGSKEPLDKLKEIAQILGID